MAKSEDELKDVERQWDAFQSTFQVPESLSDDELKASVIEDLTNVSKMTVEEYTLYQKWLEIHIKYPVHDGLFGPELNGKDEMDIRLTKENIWIPESPDDYENLEPVMVLHNGELAETWNALRTFSSKV